LTEKIQGEIPLGNTGINGRTILKWIVETEGVKLWIGFSWPTTGSNG
jgi:hypothetical protein